MKDNLGILEIVRVAYRLYIEIRELWFLMDRQRIYDHVYELLLGVVKVCNPAVGIRWQWGVGVQENCKWFEWLDWDFKFN